MRNVTLAELDSSLRALGVRHIRAGICHDGRWRVSGVRGEQMMCGSVEAYAPALEDAFAEFLDACRNAAERAA